MTHTPSPNREHLVAACVIPGTTHKLSGKVGEVPDDERRHQGPQHSEHDDGQDVVEEVLLPEGVASLEDDRGKEQEVEQLLRGKKEEESGMAKRAQRYEKGGGTGSERETVAKPRAFIVQQSDANRWSERGEGTGGDSD